MRLLERQGILTLCRMAAVFIVVGVAAGIFGQSASTVCPKEEGSTKKQSFVSLFPEGSQRLSEEEQKRRTEEVRAWAVKQSKDERAFDRRVLDEMGYRTDGIERTNDASVIALNFIEAAEFTEAVALARTHPGLRYGVSIEVPPWKDPRATGAPAP